MPSSRSLAQRQEALERANVVRAERAQLKGDLKESRCAIDVVLADPPAFVRTAKVADLLLVVPKYGPVKVNKLLRCRIAPTKTMAASHNASATSSPSCSAQRDKAHRNVAAPAPNGRDRCNSRL